jgi:hypothetical protein
LGIQPYLLLHVYPFVRTKNKLNQSQSVIISAMNLQTKQVTIEHLLYLLAFCIALGLRFLNLGEAPLSDFEAGKAIQSWYAVQNEHVEIGTNPGYFSLTVLSFNIFPVSDALARFWPALIGSLLVLAPFGFRLLLGRKIPLIITYGLALDPGLVALSRLAGGPMMAIGFGTLALAFYVNRKIVWAGITCGLALTCGPAGFFGLVGFLITNLISRLVGFLLAFNDMGESGLGLNDSHSVKRNTRLFFFIGFGTIILTSTLLTRFPAGIGAWGSGVEIYMRGWFTPSEIPVFRPVLAGMIYQPTVFVFATISAVRGWLRGEVKTRWLSVWVLTVLVISLIYPGRQVQDIAWIIPPLWTLTAIELSRFLRNPEHPIAAWGLAGVVIVLCVLFWLMSLNLVPGSPTWLILVVVPLLVIMTTILVGLGWSWDSAQSGLSWGFCVVSGIYTISVMFGATQLRSNNSEELWTPTPGIVQAGLLLDTLEELALIQTGRDDRIDIVSIADSPALKWTLRDFQDVTFVSQLDPNLLPSVIITPADVPEGAKLFQTTSYRGQDFVWSAYPGWSGALPPEWWKWITTRNAPELNESLVLWARSDFFSEPDLEEPDPLIQEPAGNDGTSPLEDTIE